MKEQNYKLVAPDIDRLLNCIEQRGKNYLDSGAARRYFRF